MNSTLDALEQSILSDNEIENIESINAPSLTERHHILYLFFLSLFSLAGYAFIFMFPAAALLIATYLPNKIISSTNYIDVAFIISEILVASFCGWISILLYQIKLINPAGRPVNKDEATQLIKLIDDLEYEHGTSKIHAIKITNKFEIDIIRTPRNGYPLLFTNTLLIG